MKDKVAVAMSGGVDSSLAAALLLEKGYDVVGVTMRLWTDFPAGVDPAVEAAREVASVLNIEHRVVDLAEPFRRTVVSDFVAEYAAGRTPNPCVRCNHLIKFGLLWESIRRTGADRMATGHYVRRRWDPEKERHLLLRGRDPGKDQSYVLYALRQEQLARLLFPLGDWSKDRVRERAQELDLPVGDRAESQEICFLRGEDYRDFLRRQIPGDIRPGPIVDPCGEVLGQHSGLPFYTVGQRRGLGISAAHPLYVLQLDPGNNALVVGPREQLRSAGAVLSDVNFLPFSHLTGPVQVQVQIRYNAPPVPAVLCPHDEGAEIRFSRPRDAVTPGQSAVCYWDDVLVGGGIICCAPDA